MQESNEDAQQPRGASGVLMPLVGERLSALAGGGGLAATQDKLRASGQNVPIVAAPEVTEAQRQRLRRAIAAYRSEA